MSKGDMMNTQREKVANLCHLQWAGWMQWLFSKGQLNDDKSFIIDPYWVERWQRQMNTAYDDLSEAEKDSDRKEADKFLDLLK